MAQKSAKRRVSVARQRRPAREIRRPKAVATPTVRQDEQEPPAGEVPDFAVVGVGASAGGLEAFTAVLHALGPEPGLALVFVQRLAPQHQSALVDLLAAQTAMPVVQVEEGLRVQPNHVYVIPPNSQLLIHGVELHIVPRPTDRSQYTPIDAFLRSLARSAGPRAIGVILSGTASDGSIGISDIKAAGGVTIAQSPESSKYDGMPRAALATGMIDLVLTPEEIGSTLGQLAASEPAPYPSLAGASDVPLMDDQREQIFDQSRPASGVDFRHYTLPTIKRPLFRRMTLHRPKDVDVDIEQGEAAESRMGRPHRTASEIAAELKRLRETNLNERDRLSLLHEISVYQEELSVQNEALVRAQAALEETRDQFIELYDFAPTGYLTLDLEGVIRRCNLAAAALLGRARPALQDMPLLGFVARSSRDEYMKFLRQRRSQNESAVEVELALQTAGGQRDVQLVCPPSRNSRREYFMSMVDITDRKELERERAQTAAEQAALANRLLSAIDEERHRIARDLHDDVGQQLTAIRMMFETALHHDGGIDPAQLRAVQQVIEHLDRRLHTVAAQLRPAALDVGVVTAIDLLLREWSTTFDIGTSLDVQRLSDADVPNSVATHLYRILQEALNNVAKHGAATKVDVRLHKRRGEIVLVVEDNGRGFDIEGARGRSSQLGLIGMRERAQLMGGRMQIQSRPGQGTSIVVSVPIP